MKYPLPIEIVKGRYPLVTQEFGDPSNAAWYQRNGVNITSHNGTDIVIRGGKHQETDTYGTRLVCPVPKGVVDGIWDENDPMSTKGNGIEIHWKDEHGFCQMLVWHCSEVVHYADEFLEGQTLGFMGNSGLVSPPPTFANVHNGAHLHLGLWINGVLSDPREVFDFTKWFVSDQDTSVEKDLPPFQYFLNKIRIALSGLFR